MPPSVASSELDVRCRAVGIVLAAALRARLRGPAGRVAGRSKLDTKTAADVFDLLRRFNAGSGCAVLVVTHDPRLSETCDRTITLVDGAIVSDERKAGRPTGARSGH